MEIPVTAHVPRLIEIFAKQYEDAPQVTLRELIQNAADALTESRLEKKQITPKIVVEVLPAEARKKFRIDLAVRDNAAGMTEQGLIDYLAKLGATTKEMEGLDTIGEYGIGFYAIVVACKSAVVVSKTENAVPIAYRFLTKEKRFVEVDGETRDWIVSREFKANDDENTSNTGTAILMEIDFDRNPKLKDWLNTDRLIVDLRTFCLLIPYPIHVRTEDGKVGEMINLPERPWNSKGIDAKDKYDQLWAIILPYSEPEDYPKLFFSFDKRLNHNSKQAKPETVIEGVAYYLKDYHGGVSLYFKHMFVETARDLVSIWGTPFTVLTNVKSTSGAPIHLNVPPSRSHVARNESYFRLSELLDNFLIEMINDSMREYKRLLKAELTNAAGSERGSEVVRKINSESLIAHALGYSNEILESICLDLAEVIADALGGDYNDNTLKDAAIVLLQERAPGVTRDTIIPALRRYTEIALEKFQEHRQTQNITRRLPQSNPSSSRNFLKECGHHLPVRVAIKEFPYGNQPQFNIFRIPISCLDMVDPALKNQTDGRTRMPVLKKGSADEYLLSKDGERVVVIANEYELLFLMCLAHENNKYKLELVSVGSTLFQNVARPEEWTDLIDAVKALIVKSQHLDKQAFYENVDVAGFDKKIVPLVMREVNGKRHLTINAWNRGMKNLNEALRESLLHGVTRVKDALLLLLHDIYNSSVFDEASNLNQNALNILDVREKVLIEICEIMMEFFDIKKSKNKQST